MQRLSRQRLSSRSPTVLIVTATVLVAACGGGGGGTPPSTRAIAKTTTNSGDAQSATVGQPLASPIQVVVTENGSAAAGVTVNWSTTALNGTLTPSGATNADGVATSAWLLGTVSGAQTAQATSSGASGSPVTFTASAAPDAAATLAPALGNAQVGIVNTPLAAPVQAKVADQFGNGVPAVDVGWAATGGTVSAGTVATNAEGISAVNVTLGGTAGEITITATAGGLTGSPLALTARATAAVATAAIRVINNSFDPAAITVAAGTTVVWTWGVGSFLHNVSPVGREPTRSGSLLNAPATYSFRFDTPGTYQYYCEAHGSPGVGMAGTVIVQ
jgi:adhesin/invasin